MNAEIISIGTELLLGNIVNTNTRDLSLMLADLGINVFWHSTVGDNPARLRESLLLAKSRADLIITTGGLGPTCDDLTRQTVCECFGVEMYFDEKVKAELEEFFAAWAPNMPNNNLSQCYLPKGCAPFYNTCGTAPGCGFQSMGKTVLMLPGPPKEMRAMMAHGGLDYLRAVSADSIFSHNLHIFGIGESHVEDMLREEMLSFQNPSLAPYAKEGEVRLRITAKAENEEKAEEMMAPVMALCREKLGDFIYGVDSDSLENTVLQLLKEKGLTFAAAESCTGGLIAKRITDLPGSSAVFRGGCTVYTNDAKNILLGVPYELIEEKSVYSAEVAIALAENVRKTLAADFGIGVTGIAGPDGDGVHDVGTVFVALACENGSFVHPLHLGARSDRSRIRTVSANYAFDMLRRALCGKEIVASWK